MSRKEARTVLPFVSKVAATLGGISSGNVAGGGGRQLAATNAKYFAYSSATSIVIMQLSDFTVMETVTITNSEITHLRLSPTNLTCLAFITRDAQFMYYDFGEGKVVFKENVQTKLTRGVFRLMEFTPDGKTVMLFSDGIDGTRLDVDLEKQKGSTAYFSMLHFMNYVLPHPTEPILLGVTDEGAVVRAQGYMDVPDEMRRVSHRTCLALDPLNNEICMAFGTKPAWVMFSYLPDFTILAKSQRKDLPAHFGDWIPTMPGSVVTASKKAGMVYVWHVASGDVAYSMQLETANVICLMRVLDKGFVVGFSDGSLGVVDVAKKSYVRKISASHTTAIFGSVIVPSNSGLLLTGGLEGSVGVWQLPTLEKKAHFSAVDKGTMTGMCVSPGGGYVACGSTEGTVSVCSLKSLAVLFTEKLHKSKCTSVAWSPYQSDVIVSSGDDCTICYYNIKERRIIESVSTGSRMRAVKFSPHENAIAAASFDGSLYVRKENAVVFSQKNPKESALFDVAWSPFEDCKIAATDRASGLILFNLSDQTCSRVVGYHVMDSVMWSQAVRNVVFTGGSDGTLTVWDVEHMTPIGVLSAHTSNIYGLACHRDHPSLVVSVGNDQRVRVWNTAALTPSAVIDAISSGEQMVAERFFPGEGGQELAKLIHRIMRDGSKISFSDNDLVHFNDVLRLTDKRITKLTSALPHDQATLRRAQRAKQSAIEAADLCLKSGNIKRYCELMFIAGEYDAALAMAPGVSYKFWKNLMNIRAEMLEGTEAGAELTLLTGDTAKAIHKFNALDRFEVSTMIAAAMRNTTFLPKNVSVGGSSHKEESTTKKQPYILHDFSNPCDFNAYRVASIASMRYLRERKPLLAAAALLTIGDLAGAAGRLLRCGELLWAYELNKRLNEPLSIINEAMSRYVISVCGWAVAFKSMDAALKRKLVTLIPFKSDEERAAFYKEHGLGTIREYVVESKKGRGLGRINMLALSGKVTEAAAESIQYIKDRMSSKEMFNHTEMNRYLELLENLDKPDNADPVWQSVVAVSFYFGVYKAMWRGYSPVIEKLGQSFEELVNDNNIDWLKSRIPEVRIAVSITLAQDSVETAKAYMDKVKGEYAAFQGLKALPSDTKYEGGSTVRAQGTGDVPVEIASEVYHSYCSGAPIHGNLFFLEDHMTAMDREEALMWFNVTPFSPLPTHKRLVAYT